LAREAFGQSQALGETVSPQAAKQYDEARQLAEKSQHAFERIVSLAPDSWQTAVFLGDVDRQHGNLVSALAHYKKAAEAEPDNAAPLLGMGTAYWELGDFEHASSCLRKFLQLNPRAPQAIFELANIAVRQHQESAAIPLLRQYLALQPDALASHADLGRAYFHLKRYRDAIPELQKAAAADEQGEIHYQLSISLRKLGQEQEADAALKRSNQIRQANLERQRALQGNH
jgi:tetratricopeptide (TPR) repeat protein